VSAPLHLHAAVYCKTLIFCACLIFAISRVA